MISGMLTAIQDFLSDSFSEGGQDLETVDTGRFKLWLTYSPKILLVAAVGGTAPVELRQVFRRSLDQIEELLASEIGNFKQDDLSVFEPACPILEACLLGQSAPDKRKKARLWPYFAALAVVGISLIGWREYTLAKWNRYFEALKHRPGIVVTGVEKGGPGWIVTGLKDPLAAEPVDILNAEHLDAHKVRYAWEPYLSLNTPFALKRDSDIATDRVRNQIIRFETNSSKVVIAEADRIDDLTREIGDLLRLYPATRITVNGHADDTGNPGTNEKLSVDRANTVVDALVAQGIPRSALNPAGLGNTKPLRAGSTDWDRSTNRGVSFEVTLP
jgi:outer membrane protein OmpA-like peptidoglycan-associated protein